jgi:hypothetical protein
LRDICTAAGLIDQRDDMVALFGSLCISAGLERLPTPPRWSGVTDDCSPIEFSTSFDADGTGVRFLIEAQDDPSSPQTYWAAGERLSRRMADSCPASLELIDALGDLFRPTDPNALFATWHAVDCRRNAAPLCKAYFNPAAHGRDASASVVATALDRLGFGRGVAAKLADLDGDVITHFAVDLVSATKARAKIYVRHFRTAPAEFDSLAQRIGIEAGLTFLDACRIVCGSSDPLRQRPVMTCYHLTAADRFGPAAMTLYLPLYPYCPADRIAAGRIAALLVEADLQADDYRRVADVLMADHDADADGLHTYVGFRRSIGGRHGEQITSYFSPSFFKPRYGRLALDPERFWPSAMHPS